MLAQPLSGWIINSAANMPFPVFWWFEMPDLTGTDKGLASAAELWHLLLFIVLAVLVLIHIAAALNHHYRKGNDILERMLSGRAR
jgi:cytochrome b561